MARRRTLPLIITATDDHRTTADWILNHWATFFTYLAYAEDFPMSYAFCYFFAMIGGHDHHRNVGLARPGQYRHRIRELEERRSRLRQSM